MSLNLEMPGDMRSRLIKGAATIVGEQMLSPSEGVIKRITQPKIGASDLGAHIADLRAWLQAWKDEEASVPGLTLSTTRKSSSGLKFTMPSGLSFDTLADYVAWIGASEDYKNGSRRIGQLVDFDERLLGMTRIWQAVSQIPSSDFLSFLELLRWRRENAEVRVPVRALAIPGLDSKWIENNRGIVAPAFRMIGAFNPEAENDLERLGFDTCDRMTVWFRCGEDVGGLSALASQFALRPSETKYGQFPGAQRVIVIENQTSFETLELKSHDVAIFGQGSQAPAALALMPWLGDQSIDVLYWGDIDGEGYRILSRARTALPCIRSILMDGDIATEHMDRLSVEIDPDRRPVPENLTLEETSGYCLVAGSGRRIEQERIPADHVMTALSSHWKMPTRRCA